MEGARWSRASSRRVLSARKPGEIGEPRLIENLIVISDTDGRYVGLNPTTGKPEGEGYHLRSAVAPAAAPVAFGKGRAFAPLTDGTIMLLSLDRLRAEKK